MLTLPSPACHVLGRSSCLQRWLYTPLESFLSMFMMPMQTLRRMSGKFCRCFVFAYVDLNQSPLLKYIVLVEVLLTYMKNHTTVVQRYLHEHVCSTSGSFLVLYGIALATAGWGVVASLEIYPPFAGSAVSAITLVVAYAFAISRPQLTLKV
jgi:hypothetical protein